MAQTEIKSTLALDFQITLKLTLAEAKALKEITGYGHKPFLEGYYKQLGKSYLQPHEKGVISLFTTIKENLGNQIFKADQMIDDINRAYKKRNEEKSATTPSPI